MATWGSFVRAFGASAPAPGVPSSEDGRLKMAGQIFTYEAEYDSHGNLEIEIEPGDDGGGGREVAGINLKYDGPEETHLEELVKAGNFKQATADAISYIANETDSAERWCGNPAVEFFLRDCIFNRGATGAMKIMQKALNVTVDGDFGPVTQATEKATESDPRPFIEDLYNARVWYEDNVVGERSNMEAGLMNRFSEARDFALSLLT
jgi:hypothetical protein